MVFLSIVITLVFERLFIQFQTYRQFNWLRDYTLWINDFISLGRFNAWLSAIIIVLPLLFIEQFVEGIFENGLFGLFKLAFGVVILYLCLGPKDLDQQIDDYIHAVGAGDQGLTTQSAEALNGGAVSSTLKEQNIQVVGAVFIQAHRRIFGCLFWFIALGPIGAVVYRLIDQLSSLEFANNGLSQTQSKLKMIMGYLEWISTRVSLFCFMLTGHFEAAFSAYRKSSEEGVEMNQTNQNILSQAGMGAIQYQDIHSDDEAVKAVKKARGLVLRSIVIWVLISFLVGFYK